MTQYMLSVHSAAGGPSEPMTEEQQREGFARIAGLEAEMEAADAFVFSARLSQPSEAQVVRRGAGRPKSTDGPFAETKEQLGGFYLIEAADIGAGSSGPRGSATQSASRSKSGRWPAVGRAEAAAPAASRPASTRLAVRRS